MTRVTFDEKYYPAVKETLYQATLENGLTVTLLPKNDFNEVYGVVTSFKLVQLTPEFTGKRWKKKNDIRKGIASFFRA